MSPFLLVVGLQGLVIFIDEFYFHHQRGLPRWERIGHPVDSFSTFIALFFLAMAPRSPSNEIIFIGLAIASSLCVTKDEWVHSKICRPAEMWLHSVLFVLHPVVLITAMNEWENQPLLILGASGAIFIFMIYQIVYWNFIASKIPAQIEIKT